MITLSPKSQRKMTASTLEYLLTVFNGDADAMYAAIDEYKANTAKASQTTGGTK